MLQLSKMEREVAGWQFTWHGLEVERRRSSRGNPRRPRRQHGTGRASQTLHRAYTEDRPRERPALHRQAWQDRYFPPVCCAWVTNLWTLAHCVRWVCNIIAHTGELGAGRLEAPVPDDTAGRGGTGRCGPPIEPTTGGGRCCCCAMPPGIGRTAPIGLTEAASLTAPGRGTSAASPTGGRRPSGCGVLPAGR